MLAKERDRMCLNIKDSLMSISSSPVFILCPRERSLRGTSWESNTSDVIEVTRNMRFALSLINTQPLAEAETETVSPGDESCIDKNDMANMIAIEDEGDLEGAERDRTLELWRIVEGDNVVQMKRLLKRNPDAVHWVDWSGRTALHFAAEQGQYMCLNLLLKNGADPDVVDHLGHLPLHLAADSGRLSATVTLLRSSRKGIDRKSWSLGWTPLHHAVFDGTISVINSLLNFGAEINIRDHMKRTPLALAKKYRPDSDRLLKLLKSRGGRG